MKHLFTIMIMALLLFSCNKSDKKQISQSFPDGSPMSNWFLNTTKINIDSLGTKYVITEHGVVDDSNLVQTKAIQAIIDTASKNGGGVIIVPEGIFLSGALFFKPKTHLHVAQGAVLKGSDTIADYPIMPSRMEGRSIDYFPALVNAYGVNGFTISGEGTINGNGLKYWVAFWQRRNENAKCTNLEVSRPRLVFIQHSDDVQIQDVRLINAGFWSSHYYKCNRVKILDLYIFSPAKPVKAPSTDAIDIDVCTNVLIKGCYMSVNDDAIALKGGKGPFADKDTTNGANENILIEDCEFGFSHSTLTCGSENIHTKNVIMRNCKAQNAKRLFWLKMRPDTPQKYEYIILENITGQVHSGIYIKPWTQFFDLQGREDVPLSYSENIILKNIDLDCHIFFDVRITENDRLQNFTFKDMNIETEKSDFNKSLIQNLTLKNVQVNGVIID